MAGETTMTVVGNLTADPTLRYTQGGTAVTNFTVASTPRRFDRESNEWKDGEALFLDCTVWREHAEQVAQSLSKGTRVVVIGRLVQRRWTTEDGQKQSKHALDVDEVGPSLKYATATVQRVVSNAHQKASERWGIDGDEPF